MNNYLKIMAIVALPLVFAGCADNDEVIAGDETVEVSFSAALPQKIQSRAAGSTLKVNKVVCATFDNEGNEISALRKVVDIVDGQNIEYAPRLVNGHTYQVAFWAMKDDAYDATDMKNIARTTDNSTLTESDFECFANHTAQFTVSGNASSTITLNRPVARLRLGTTEADLKAVKDLGYTPTSIEVKLTTNNAYNALEGKVTGTATEKTFTLPVSDGSDNITAGESTYKSLTSNYVFASDGNVTVTLTIKGKKGESTTEETVCTRTVDNVPLNANKNTNIVGDLMTGTVIYTVTMESEYGDGDE